MTEPRQCTAKLVADNAGYTHEIYCTRDAGHVGPHRGDTVWLDPDRPVTAATVPT